MKITITIEDKNGGVEFKATGVGEDENSTALAIAKSLGEYVMFLKAESESDNKIQVLM